MLEKPRNIIAQAYAHSRAVVAFNTINAETTIAIVRAAVRAKLPTLFEVSEKTIAYLGMRTVVELITSVVSEESGKVPMGFHLDHGHSFKICQQAIAAGFPSVMIDASALSFKENVALTRRVVNYAHKRGVLVQGELGALVPVRGRRLTAKSDLMTHPEQAAEFVSLTGVDTLGVAVGTLHGPAKMFHKLPHIDFGRLAAIHKQVNIPLVLHGASGVPASHLRRAMKLGVSVVNIDTELRLAYLAALKHELRQQPSEYDPRVIFTPVVEALAATAYRKLKSLNIA